jgi:pimeloyl-ACP methyl ester carboxylesterase
LSAALKRIRTSVLDVAYEESGATDGAPVFLMHGWPYDPRCYDAVIAPLAAAGARVIVPYLRGFGPTRFLDQSTRASRPRSATICAN